MSYRLTVADRARFKGQCFAILERLATGPATNRELATIALKYTSRTDDLRKAGYVIDCERAGDAGLTVYHLRGRVEPTQLALALGAP